ncbi:hypothetical protein HanHA89_Chr14g0582001 [Helianthus annuus]|nr:hypothetical protein HanHA89_Chr14g0582001 [Helianthus annuus]
MQFLFFNHMEIKSIQLQGFIDVHLLFSGLTKKVGFIETDLQLKLKKEALQLERSVNWNSTTQIHRRKGLAIAASRTKTQLTEVGPFVHQ